MAEVAELFLPPFEEAEGDEDDEGIVDYSETLGDPLPLWASSSAFAGTAVDPDDLFVPDFSSGLSPLRLTAVDSDGGSDSGSDYLDDPAGLALDLFDRCPPQPSRESIDPFTEALESDDFRVLDGVEDMGSDYLELGLGLGFGSGFERQEDGGGSGNREVGSDWGEGDVCFLGHRSSGESHRARPADGEGLRIVGFESESDSDDDQIADGVGDSEGGGTTDRIMDDLGLPLCWDCLHIEEDRRDPDEEFEWEEVDRCLDEQEVLSMMVGAEDGSDGRGELDHDNLDLEDDEDEDLVRNVEWEVLLAVNNLGRNPSVEPEDSEFYLGDDNDDFNNASEYEVLFGQFIEHDNALRGSPPAAKLVVENLSSIVLTQEDVVKNNILCAVCKDEISLEESAKQLPCLHHYHGDCILPWLGIRNTCPVCRYELPTDDPDYENWRTQRAGGSGALEESPIRYDFEMFPEV